MIIIELEGKEYRMPESWTEVKLETFEKIVKHISVLSDYKSQYQYAIELFSILTDAPTDDLYGMTKASFEELSKRCEWASGDVEATDVKSWVIEGEEFMAVKDLNSLTMGDTISLELTIQNSQSWELLTNILPILIRKVKVISKPDGEVKKVPEKFDADNYEETKQLFRKHLNVADVNQLKDFF